MTDVLQPFGRYFLLDRIAKGGMAEIFRARLAQADAAGRIVVIKRIGQSFDTNSQFLRMFRDEIRISMALSHPNIATLHDFGEQAGHPFIIMEWIDGKDLREFLARMQELNRPMPPEFAAQIIAEAAQGLHYAHSFTDKTTGAALNIVHRDMSPRNILLSYHGIVKVIDFGIAKATSNLETTITGMIKGKPSYLAPEQLSGAKLDGRCDVFALGSVLWEMLTWRKLFQGADDASTINQIENCERLVVPPSLIRPELPKELDEIVLKALRKNPDDRYASAEDLQIALTRFAHARRPGLHLRDIARFTNELFSKDIERDIENLQRLNRLAEERIRTRQPPPQPIPLKSPAAGIIAASAPKQTPRVYSGRLKALGFLAALLSLVIAWNQSILTDLWRESPDPKPPQPENSATIADTKDIAQTAPADQPEAIEASKTGFEAKPNPEIVSIGPPPRLRPAPRKAIEHKNTVTKSSRATIAPALRSKPSVALKSNPPISMPRSSQSVASPKPKPVIPRVLHEFRLEPLKDGVLWTGPGGSGQITLRFVSKGAPISIALVDFIHLTHSGNGSQKDLTNIFQFQSNGTLTAPAGKFLHYVTPSSGIMILSIRAMDPQGNGLSGTVQFRLKKEQIRGDL